MEEIVPGVVHWVTEHEVIRQPVHSHLDVAARALLDPRVPDEGVEAVERWCRPEVIVLSNRHHLRHAQRFAEAFGCGIRCHRDGLHEFEGGDEVEGFEWGDEVAPGVVAHEVGALCPDETALHLTGPRAMLLADAVIRHPADGELAFVPDFLIGEDPEAVKRGMLASLERLLELDWDALLLAHGNPIPAGGRDALREFVAAGGRSAAFG